MGNEYKHSIPTHRSDSASSSGRTIRMRKHSSNHEFDATSTVKERRSEYRDETTSGDDRSSYSKYSQMSVDITQEMEAVNKEIQALIKRCDEKPSYKSAVTPNGYKMPREEMRMPIRGDIPKKQHNHAQTDYGKRHIRTRPRYRRSRRNFPPSDLVDETKSMVSKVYRTVCHSLNNSFNYPMLFNPYGRYYPVPHHYPPPVFCHNREGDFSGSCSKCCKFSPTISGPKWKDVLHKDERHFHDTSCIKDANLFQRWPRNESNKKELCDKGVNTNVQDEIVVKEEKIDQHMVHEEKVSMPSKDERKVISPRENTASIPSNQRDRTDRKDYLWNYDGDFEVIKNSIHETTVTSGNLKKLVDREDSQAGWRQLTPVEPEFRYKSDAVNATSKFLQKPDTTEPPLDINPSPFLHGQENDDLIQSSNDSGDYLKRSHNFISKVVSQVVAKNAISIDSRSEEIDSGACINIIKRLADLLKSNSRRLSVESFPGELKLQREKIEHLKNIEKEIARVEELEDVISLSSSNSRQVSDNLISKI